MERETSSWTSSYTYSIISVSCTYTTRKQAATLQIASLTTMGMTFIPLASNDALIVANQRHTLDLRRREKVTKAWYVVSKEEKTGNQ